MGDRYHSEPQSGNIVTEEFTTLRSPTSHSNVTVTREMTASMRPTQSSGGYTITREVRSSRSPGRTGRRMVTSHEMIGGHSPVIDHSSTVTRGVTSTRAPLRGGSVTTVTREMTSGGQFCTSPRSPSQYASEVSSFIPLTRQYLGCKKHRAFNPNYAFTIKNIFNCRSLKGFYLRGAYLKDV